MRNQFAEFLERLVAENESPLDWYEFVVNHYFDDLTESIRRQLGRLGIERDPSGFPAWLDADREQFRRWAEQLRSRAG